MDTLAKADTFFFITTIAVVLITVLLAVLIIYLIKIFRDVKHISQKARTETDLFSEDLDELRGKMKNGFRLSALFVFLKKLFLRRKKS